MCIHTACMERKRQLVAVSSFISLSFGEMATNWSLRSINTQCEATAMLFPFSSYWATKGQRI